MRKSSFGFLVLMAVLVTLSCISQSISATEYNCTNCTDCSTKIQAASSGDIVRLNATITNHAGNCIEFDGTDNVTFDCDGFTVNGDGITAGRGIYLSNANSGSNNNTIRDCPNISDFNWGIYLMYSENNTIVNASVYYNSEHAIYIWNGDNSRLINITAVNNSQYSIYISSSPNVTLRNVTITKQSKTAGLYFQKPSVSPSKSLFVHDIDTSNTVNGRPIHYFDGSYRPCPDNQTLDYNTSASFVGLVGCSNVTIANTHLDDKILIAYTNDSAVVNSSVNGTRDGIQILYSINNTLNNITSSNNFQDGIYLRQSNNNTLADIRSENNSNNGIIFANSHNNTLYSIYANNNPNVGIDLGSGSLENRLYNITARYNGYGIMFHSSSDLNVIENMVLEYNDKGIYFSGSDSNSLTNITISHSTQYGIYIQMGSEYNNMTNSIIENSTNYGIYLDYTMSNPRFNLFNNNIFNNTINVYSDNESNMNNWNTTLNCSAGPNIIGGNCIGGNYWTDPDGNFSDTCADDSYPYRVCDSSYTPQTNNTDYLPLTDQSLFTCDTCSDCSEKINYAFAGDTIRLSSHITGQDGDCIVFTGQDDLTFDCDGFTIGGDGDNIGYGIDLTGGSDNNTVMNCPNISHFRNGLNIASDYNRFLDLSLINNSYDGVSVNGNYNNFTNLTVFGSGNRGFHMILSDHNTLRNVNVTHNSGQGIYMMVCNDNKIIDSTLVEASYGALPRAIQLYDSNNNTIENTTLMRNGEGIRISGDSKYNTINNSIIEDNTDYGIYLSASGSNYPRYNTFYNNFLNNTVNLYSDNESNLNYWNASLNCSAGPNIIGGNCIGGNFWTSPGGNYSNLCQDSTGDGICDYSYTPQINNTDFLALTDVSPGFHCRNCSDCSTKIQAASSGDIIKLNASITNHSGDCIDFNGTDNVTFDCNGLTISGTGSGDGIYLSSTGDGSNNNTIRNCPDISNFNVGIVIFDSNSTKIENLKTHNNGMHGFIIFLSHNNNFTNITAVDNANSGIYSYKLTNSTINGLNASNNGKKGLYFVWKSHNNSFLDVEASYNGEYGIYVWCYQWDYRCEYNNFTNVDAFDNGVCGIWSEYAIYSMYENVTITKQGNAGGLFPSGGGYAGSFINVTVNGKPVLNFHDTYNPCPNNQILEYNDTYAQLALSNCYNVTVRNSTFTDSLYFFYIDNSTVYDVNSSYSLHGLYITGDYNNITYNTAMGISRQGARIRGRYNNFTHNTVLCDQAQTALTLYNSQVSNSWNIISDNVLRGNDWGIYTYGNCNNNTYSNNLILDSGVGIVFDGQVSGALIENNTLYNNTIGIMLSKTNQKNHRIINNTIYGSSDKAITLGDASNLTIKGNTIYDNGYGIYLEDSTNGTIHGNTIRDNTYYGIYFNNTRNMTVYNNMLSNTVNFHSNNASNRNYLNTTYNCSAGPNIIGGDCMGGNLWTSSAGSFSNLCGDSDGDGICDSAYTPSVNSVDYFPIQGCVESWSCTAWSHCSSGFHTRSCTDANNCGTVLSKPAESGNCIQAVGGGTGTEPPEEIKNWGSIIPGEEVFMEIHEPELGLTEISISVNREVERVSVTVTRLDSRPPDVAKDAVGMVYHYVRVEKSNLEDEDIEKAKLKFRVRKTWISGNRIGKNTVVLSRYITDWETLLTTLLSEDDDYVYYEAGTAGFSVFAITGEEMICDPGEKRCSGNHLQECNTDGVGWETIETCEYGCDSGTLACKEKETACEPGERRCNGNVLQECSGDGYAWEMLEICGYQCVGNECIGNPYYYIITAIVLVIIVVIVLVVLISH